MPRNPKNVTNLHWHVENSSNFHQSVPEDEIRRMIASNDRFGASFADRNVPGVDRGPGTAIAVACALILRSRSRVRQIGSRGRACAILDRLWTCGPLNVHKIDFLMPPYHLSCDSLHFDYSFIEFRVTYRNLQNLDDWASSTLGPKRTEIQKFLHFRNQREKLRF